MATTEKGKKKLTGTKKATVKTTKKPATVKKTETEKSIQQEIEKLEKALDAVDNKNIVDLVPEEIKEDVKKDVEVLNGIDAVDRDLEDKIKSELENITPSEEIVEKMEELNESKKLFEEQIEKAPEKAVELARTELNKMAELKKKTEELKNRFFKESEPKNNGTTFFWNGVRYDF